MSERRRSSTGGCLLAIAFYVAAWALMFLLARLVVNGAWAP